MRSHKPKSTNPRSLASAASRIENKPAVVRRIAALQGRIDDKVVARVATGVVVTRQWIIDELWDNAMRAKAAVPVLDRAGKPTGTWVCDLAASNRALHLLGLECGMFKGDKPVDDPIDSMTGQEVADAIEILKALSAQKRQQ